MILASILSAGAIAPLFHRGDARPVNPSPNVAKDTALAQQNAERKTPANPQAQGAGQSVQIALGDGNASTGPGYQRRPSSPPKDWGMSQACAQMVRKNRLHAHGLSHARI